MKLFPWLLFCCRQAGLPEGTCKLHRCEVSKQCEGEERDERKCHQNGTVCED